MRRALALSLCLAAAACTCDPGPNPPPPPCTRLTCQPNQCGDLTDGCNGILRCGSCPAGQTCGAGGAANTCGTGTCTAKTCFELGKNCDLVSDGCSKLLDCGRCARPSDCGANGKPNVCGGPSCLKTTCGPVCGKSISDECGGTLGCEDAGCSSPFDTCGGGTEDFRCGCTRHTCQELGKNCGDSDDGCGTTLHCGSCADDAGTCGGGGYEGVCGTCTGAGGRVCTSSCWCWDDPRPFGGTIGAIHGVAGGEVWLFAGGGLFARGSSVTGFTGVGGATRGTPRNAWARSADDIYAVTNHQGSLLVHWDGVSWSPVQVPTQQPLTGIWGLPSGEAWAVSAGGSILHLQNGTWTNENPMTNAVFEDVWASASDDVWVVGTDLLHFDGTSWATTQTPRVLDVHGTARNDVWHTSAAGVRHFDGTAWASSYTSGPMQRVWATSPTDVWAGGNAGAVIHFDGMSWAREDLGTTEAVTALWASGPNDVWVATTATLFHRDANGWRALSSVPGNGFSGIHLVSATEGWAAGDRGRIVRYDGAAWAPVHSGTVESLASISGAADRLWAVGSSGTILGRRRDGGWAREASTVTTSLEAVHAVSASEAYAVGTSSVLLSTDGGGSWSRLPAPQSGFTGTPRAVWGTSDHDLWVGESAGRVRHLTDAGWTQYLTGAAGEVVGLWGSGGEVFAAIGLSTQAVALRFTDGGWQMLGGSSGASFDAVWGRSPTDVWFSGSGGLVQHWTGAMLERVPSGTEHGLSAISGDPASSTVWAAGAASSVVQIDGVLPGRFELVKQTRLGDELTGVFALSRDDIWAVGGPAPHHYDGRSWRTSGPTVNGARLLALWGAAANDVWATGSSGRVVHWDGGSWGEVPAPVFNSADITSVWGAQSNAVWATAYSVLGKWNGTQWLHESLNGTPHLYAVHGTAVNDVWAVGSEIWHFDGVSWQLVVASTPADLRTVWCASRTECWAAGGTALMKWEGSVWSERITPTPYPAVIWGASARDMYLFSTDGEVFHWDGVKFSRQLSGTPEVLRAATGTDAGTWAVGRNTIVFHPP